MIDRKAFFDAVRAAPFGGRLTSIQVDGLNHILDYWEAHRPDGSPDSWLAYILATVFHETGHIMQPIEEYGHGAGKPYGPSGFYGRGLVQLTWRENYQKFEARGIEGLVAHPERALEWDVALKILFDGMIEGLFTGHKLADYFTPTSPGDSINARRIVNGLDKAAEIAVAHQHFLRAINAGHASPPAPEPAPEPTPVSEPSEADKLNEAELERHRAESPQQPSESLGQLSDVLSLLGDMLVELRAIRHAVEGDAQEIAEMRASVQADTADLKEVTRS